MGFFKDLGLWLMGVDPVTTPTTSICIYKPPAIVQAMDTNKPNRGLTQLGLAFPRTYKPRSFMLRQQLAREWSTGIPELVVRPHRQAPPEALQKPKPAPYYAPHWPAYPGTPNAYPIKAKSIEDWNPTPEEEKALAKMATAMFGSHCMRIEPDNTCY